MYERIPDHADRAASLLIQQFREAPNLNNLVRIFAAQVQEAEDESYRLVTLRDIDTAENAQLDGFGEILGEPRLGRTDEFYRLWLRFRIFINTSKGRPEDLIEACRFVSNYASPGGRVLYWENHPASFQLYTDGLYMPGVIDADLDAFAELETGGDELLLFANDDQIIFNPGNPDEFNSILDLLRSIAPAAIGKISVQYSLGLTPFSVAGESLPATLELEDGSGLLLFESGDEIVVTGIETQPAFGLGFAELGTVQLLLESGDLLLFANGDSIDVLDNSETSLDGELAGHLVESLQEE